MKRLIDLTRDILVALATGLLIGLALVLIFALIGGIVNGLQGALEASRGVVLVVGGLLLLFSGILMLKGGNLPADAFSLQPWKKKELQAEELTQPLNFFRCLPRQYAYSLISAGILVTSLIPESIVLNYL